MRRFLFASAILIASLSYVLAEPLYQETNLPPSGATLMEIPVTFTVPAKILLEFSSSKSAIIDPGVTDLAIKSDADGSFYILHDELYAHWKIEDDDNRFSVYLYIPEQLTGKNNPDNKLHWKVSCGNGSVGGYDDSAIYCGQGDNLSEKAILLAKDKSEGVEPITIDLDIDGIISAGTYAEDTYSGHIVLRYENG